LCKRYLPWRSAAAARAPIGQNKARRKGSLAMRSSWASLLPTAILVVCSISSASGQSWADILKEKAAQQAVNAADQATDQGLDANEGAIRCLANDQACIDQAEQQGKDVVVTNKKGKPLPPDQQPKSGASASSGQSGTSSGAGAGSSAGQPNLTAVRSDFVPGDKLIFYDDFTDMRGDEPPPHWKVRGGTAELRTAGDIRQLTLLAHGMMISPNVKTLPRNFTLEADYQFGPHGGNGNGAIWYFRKDSGGSPTMMVDMLVQEGGTRIVAYAGPIDAMESIGDTVVKVNQDQPIYFAIWAQEGRIRIYLNGNRAIDVNQIELGTINYVEMDAAVDQEMGGYVGIRRARIAETAPDFSKTIMSGRYVTRGILFDVDSDRIKPESAATIKMIASGMQASAGARFLIEGHTDSTGDAAHNMDLSKRRAEAVKAVLVSQFGIDAARLTTAGLGSTKPVASNDTPQGRAENRRVEFVRQ
jgi:outer membrane protein OmpA-like peptidoglycan-associated protein